MVNHKWIIGINLFFIIAFISCGKPVKSEQKPAGNTDVDHSAEHQKAVVRTSPSYEQKRQVYTDLKEDIKAPQENKEEIKENVKASQESLEEMKQRIGFDKVWPSEVSEHEYIGVKKCSLCHKKESQGSQYSIWQDTAHAKAYEVLGTPEAKAVADILGIEDPQQSGKCLRCHSTAYAFGEQKVTDSIPVEEAISCETCHGPGKDYMKLKTMKDREKAIKAGLNIPDEQTCLKCHNETAPNVKPFIYQESWDKIKHPIPKKAE